jgi:hypothetical protein
MTAERRVRYDRHGCPEYAPSAPAKKALAILAGAAEKRAAEERANLKNRQDAGDLTSQERMLSAIFGDIKCIK